MNSGERTLRMSHFWDGERLHLAGCFRHLAGNSLEMISAASDPFRKMRKGAGKMPTLPD
jgi:hypothetical protein